MKKEEVFSYIRKKGYCTEENLKEKFSGDMEVLDMNVTFLMENHQIRKALFNSDNGEGALLYVQR